MSIRQNKTNKSLNPNLWKCKVPWTWWCVNLDGDGSQAERRGGQERILGTNQIAKGHWGWGAFLIKEMVSWYLVRTRRVARGGKD